MGSPSPSLTSTTITIMQLFVFLSIVSLALAAPMPEGEDAPAALPYVHDATGDVAEAYVHEEIPAVEDDSAAEAYVHEEIAAEAYVHDATGDVAEEYVHVEPVVPAVVPACPRDIHSLPLRRSVRRTSCHLSLPRSLSLRSLSHWMCQQRRLRGSLRINLQFNNDEDGRRHYRDIETEDRGQKTEDRRQRMEEEAEDGGWKTGDRGWMTRDRVECRSLPG